jgi:hypothetical protein
MNFVNFRGIWIGEPRVISIAKSGPDSRARVEGTTLATSTRTTPAGSSLMPRRRDPNFTTGHVCRFCGELVPWGSILRLIRVDPDTPGFMLNESACHTECLRGVLRTDVPLTFHRHWNGRAPMLDDDADIFFPLSPRVRGLGEGAKPKTRPCAICAKTIAAADLVRLRVQKPAGPVKQPEFDEQTLPLHAACLAAVSTMRLG